MLPTPAMPPTKDFKAARTQFMELYGSTAVMNTFLKIALLAMSAVCLGLIVLNFRSNEVVRNFKPMIVRINELGQANALSYGSFEYHPQEAEIKYFLTQFVQMYYGRMRATVRENYARSLYFLDGRLTSAIIEADKKNKTLENFLIGTSEEIEVDVKNVSIEDLRRSPYRATVDFEKIYYTAADHLELRREKYVANFVFVVKDHVSNAAIPVNPLGLTITYFREDQAFQ
jgi:type IV secretion system protein VirB5